jgi:hypothetical protein
LLHDVGLYFFELGLLEGITLRQERNDVCELLELLDREEVLILGMVTIEEVKDQMNPFIMYLCELTNFGLVLIHIFLLNRSGFDIVTGHARLELIGDDGSPLLNVMFISVPRWIDDGQPELRVVLIRWWAQGFLLEKFSGWLDDVFIIVFDIFIRFLRIFLLLLSSDDFVGLWNIELFNEKLHEAWLTNSSSTNHQDVEICACSFFGNLCFWSIKVLHVF